MPKSEVYNQDCCLGMKEYPDKYFDLAICDPDYGIGENWKKDRHSKFYTHNSTYKNATIPTAEYFKELFRVSKNQIIWGGNYYTEYLPARNSWIVWDKMRSYNDSHMAEGELAWNSFNIPVLIFKIQWNGFKRDEPRYGVHPHEKPTALYRRQLQTFAKPGDKILDTHLGSGSSRIAAYDMNFDFTGYEIDFEYFQAQEKRFNQFKSQLKIFV